MDGLVYPWIVYYIGGNGKMFTSAPKQTLHTFKLRMLTHARRAIMRATRRAVPLSGIF